MRYRPFGRAAAAVSSVCLVVDDQPMREEARTALIYAALEAGVNAFDIQTGDPAIAATVGRALSAVERGMVFVSLRLGWRLESARGRISRDLSPEGLAAALESFLTHSGLERADVAVVDVREGEELPAHVLPALKAAQAARQVRAIGVSGADGADPYLRKGAFEVLMTPFSVRSGWRERNRLNRATQADIAVIGYGFHAPAPPAPEPIEKTVRSAGLLGLNRLFAAPREPVFEGPYAFLERVDGWTAEELCLGYALTEPSLASVHVQARQPNEIQALAAVVDRELPAGVAAQIEMARFSDPALCGAA